MIILKNGNELYCDDVNDVIGEIYTEDGVEYLFADNGDYVHNSKDLQDISTILDTLQEEKSNGKY